MYRPRFFGMGGSSSPREEKDERVEGVRLWLKKPDDATSLETGDDERVLGLGRWPRLARLFVVFPVDGRPAVPVLGRDDDDEAAFVEEAEGRTPDKDERDCMNRLNNTPFSLTSPGAACEMSIVVRAAAVLTRFCGSAGTGGGGSSLCIYLSRSPPVLIRFKSFDHIPPGDSSSFVFCFGACDPRPSS